MDTKIITRVNNVDIVATSDEQLVPIRPICEALGIDFARQRKKIQEDEDLSSVVVLTPSTGSDGKQYEMLCLPIRYIFGWLFILILKMLIQNLRKPLKFIAADATTHCTTTSSARKSGSSNRIRLR